MTNRTHNKHTHSSRGGVLVQMAVIIALGFVIGLADAFVFRPIDLTPRQAPKTVEEILAEHKAQQAASDKAKPDAVIPAAPNSASTTRIDPTASSGTAAVTPGGAGEAGAEPFKFTPKDQLPKGQVTVDEAKSLFDAGAVFIDARKPEEFEKGHIRDAFRLTADMFKSGDPAELALIPRSSILVVYCNGGHCDESENVAKMMDNSGYKAGVYVIHDGYPGWKAAGHPTAEGKSHYE